MSNRFSEDDGRIETSILCVRQIQANAFSPSFFDDVFGLMSGSFFATNALSSFAKELCSIDPKRVSQEALSRIDTANDGGMWFSLLIALSTHDEAAYQHVVADHAYAEVLWRLERDLPSARRFLEVAPNEFFGECSIDHELFEILREWLHNDDAVVARFKGELYKRFPCLEPRFSFFVSSLNYRSVHGIVHPRVH